MNIIINQRKFITAIRAVERIVSKNVSLPILQAILLKTEGGQVKLMATNLEVGIQYRVGAKIEAEGVIAVPARILSDFINTVQDEKLTLSTERDTLFLNSEHYKTQILGMKSDEFPIIPTVKASAEFKISGTLIAGALGSVFDATSLLETRPELSGVYVYAQDTRVTFAATDSFRLSERVVMTVAKIDKSFIIPRTTALEIIRLTADRGDEEVTVAVAENQIALRGSDFELVSRLIDGRYPDHKKIIPEHYASTAVVNKAELERNVRMASIFSSSISDLALKAESGTLHISAKNSDKGEIVSQMPLGKIQTPFTVSVNYRYLLDGLKIIPTENIIIGYTGEGSPLVLKGEGREDQVYIIMPLRQ